MSSIKKWLPLLAMLATYLLPAVAFAQGGPFDLPEDDLSRRTFIEPLFGPLLPGGSDTSPLTSLMATFNAALLVVGGILMAYTIIAGTMSTAHDGEMLGKKWSSMWLPIRTSLGVGAVLPVLGGSVKGWCVAQFIVVWLAMQGAGLANTLWDSFLGPDGGSISASASYNPPTNLQAVRDAYAAMMINSTCVAAHQNEKNSSGADAASMGISDYRMLTQVKDGNLKIYYGRPKENIIGQMSNADCGVLMLDEESEESILQGTNATSSKLLNMTAISRPVIEARRKAFMEASVDMQELGQRIAADQATQEEVNNKMTELLNAYSTSVTQVAQEAYATNVDKGFLQDMKRDGWVMAGAYYMQLSKTQDLITRSISNAPAVVTPIRDTVFNSTHSEAVQRSIGQARALATNSNRDLVGGVSAIGGESSDGNSEDSRWVNQIVSWFINKDSGFGDAMTNPGSHDTVDFNENPIIMAKGLGEKMTATAWGALVAFTLITGSGIGGAGSAIAPIFGTLFMLLLIPGATLSTYLPLLPYILWLGVVIGWAILLIEAVIAAPLWAIVHLAPDGDGVVGRGGQGYMLVLSLVLRPALMIIGLAAAFVLMKPIGYLVNSTFVGAFFLNVAPGPFGLTQMIAGCLIYASLMVIIVQRVFSLIHVIPDRLLRWIGAGSGGELGQEAGALDQGSSQKMTAALQAGNQMNNSLIGMANNTHRDRIANKDRAKIEDAQLQTSVQGAKGDHMDSMQNAEMAADRANNAEKSGNPDEGLHGEASLRFGQAARQAERSAEIEAKADHNSGDSRDFISGLERARVDESQGKTGAVNAYLKDQTEEARQAQASGSARPFQETLLQRESALAKASEHGTKAGSVRSAKEAAMAVEREASGYDRMADGAKDQARTHAREARFLAKESSTPEAQEFMSGAAAAYESGDPAVQRQFLDEQTAKAVEAQQNGEAQPFQERLANRAIAVESEQSYRSKAEAIRAPMAPPPELDEFGDEIPPRTGGADPDPR